MQDGVVLCLFLGVNNSAFFRSCDGSEATHLCHIQWRLLWLASHRCLVALSMCKHLWCYRVNIQCYLFSEWPSFIAVGRLLKHEQHYMDLTCAERLASRVILRESTSPDHLSTWTASGRNVLWCFWLICLACTGCVKNPTFCHSVTCRQRLLTNVDSY